MQTPVNIAREIYAHTQGQASCVSKPGLLRAATLGRMEAIVSCTPIWLTPEEGFNRMADILEGYEIATLMLAKSVSI